MNKKIIKDEIRWLLEAINEQFEVINGQDEKIPQIEFDILMENVRKFYEKMQLLKRINDQVSPSVETGSTPKQVSRPAEAEPAPQNPAPVPFKPVVPPPARHSNGSPSKNAAKTQEIDLFASEEPAFNIKLKEAREKTFGPKIQPEHIDNLKAAISINEKFMFINELFDGNLREYNETIETLNGFKNLDQAADYLDLMRKKNFWNTGSNAFKKLKELVERRF